MPFSTQRPTAKSVDREIGHLPCSVGIRLTDPVAADTRLTPEGKREQKSACCLFAIAVGYVGRHPLPRIDIWRKCNRLENDGQSTGDAAWRRIIELRRRIHACERSGGNADRRLMVAAWWNGLRHVVAHFESIGFTVARTSPSDCRQRDATTAVEENGIVHSPSNDNETYDNETYTMRSDDALL